MSIIIAFWKPWKMLLSGYYYFWNITMIDVDFGFPGKPKTKKFMSIAAIPPCLCPCLCLALARARSRARALVRRQSRRQHYRPAARPAAGRLGVGRPADRSPHKLEESHHRRPSAGRRSCRRPTPAGRRRDRRRPAGLADIGDRYHAWIIYECVEHI